MFRSVYVCVGRAGEQKVYISWLYGQQERVQEGLALGN